MTVTTAPLFDYIVVGGGTAGLVVASRLSEDEAVRVLVIEAGPDHGDDPTVSTPGAVVGQFGNPKYDWNFHSVPQPALHGRTISQPRGFGLGGCSSINFMMWLHPSRASLDAWAELGNPGWAYDDLAPYFQKACTIHPPSETAKEMASLGSPHDFAVGGEKTQAASGPIQVSFSEGYTEIFNKAWVKTFDNLGYKLTGDPRTGKAIGAFQNPASIDPETKTRSSSAKAYLGPEVRQRANLTIMTNSVVKRIVFERDATDGSLIAKGVVVVQQAKDGSGISDKGEEEKETTIPVNRRAAIPQLLELSGIGGKDLLERHGVEVLIDNAAVGENAQDHAVVLQSFEVADGVASSDMLRDPAALEALSELYRTTNGGGPLGQSNISTAYMPLVDGQRGGLMSVADKKALLDAHLGESGAEGKDEDHHHHQALRSVIEPPDEPTAQYVFFPGQIDAVPHPDSLASYLAPTAPENFASIITCLNHPASRGSVHIVSPDVRTKPAWDPRYLSHPLDLEVLARHVQFVERVVAAEPLRSSLKQGGARLPPVSEIASGEALEDAKEIVRRRQISIFHPTGTCAMLPRERGGVVDVQLRIYGTRNVRVVDASVCPMQPLGNTQSVVYAVAERAADLIRNGRRKV
ncbi:aryl-alcohol dehydrogenase [Apiospora arundinis]